MPKRQDGDMLGSSVKVLLTELETCGVLSLSRSTLRRLWAEGAITPVHVRRALRFPISEIERFVSGLQAQASNDDGGTE
jgi:excisionase family DNA binding protein